MTTPMYAEAPSSESDRGSITSEPGAHPIGTGFGAAVCGIAAGALVGSVAGPVGTVLGAAVGAAAGGLAGHAASEAFNPSRHDAYWREAREPYLKNGDTQEDYLPGYLIGYEAAGRHTVKKPSFEGAEPGRLTRYERQPLGRTNGAAG